MERCCLFLGVVLEDQIAIIVDIKIFLYIIYIMLMSVFFLNYL